MLGFEGLAILKLLVVGLVSWTIEAILAFTMGRFVFPMPGTGLTPPSVARAIIYARALGLLMILGLIPVIRPIVIAASVAWQVITTTAAFKHSFAWSLPRSAGALVIGAPVYVLAMWEVLSILK